MAQNIIAAPDVQMTPANMAAWRDAFPHYAGTFLSFMAEPSAERERWLQTMSREVTFDGPVLIQKYS